MASSAAVSYISLAALLNTSYTMLALTSTFAVVRIGVGFAKATSIHVEDVLVAISYLTFLALTIMYIVLAPILFREFAVMEGKTAPYATLEQDARLTIRTFFAETILLWTTLWLVKTSFLAIYRRLIAHSRVYMRFWWAVVVFCGLSYVGCIVSNFTSCSSMHAWFTPGECATEQDQRAQQASLYYSYTVDVISDLLIIALPIRVVWKLQMARSRKLGVIGLFCVGVGAMLAATLRVVSIGVKSGNKTPSSTWLALWAIIESGIAVIVGTAPGLYVTAKSVHTSFKASAYGARRSAYEKHTGDHVFDSHQRSKTGASTIHVFETGSESYADVPLAALGPHQSETGGISETTKYNRGDITRIVADDMVPPSPVGRGKIVVTRGYTIQEEGI